MCQNMKGWVSQKCELQSFVFQKVLIWQRFLANQYNFRCLKWFSGNCRESSDRHFFLN